MVGEVRSADHIISNTFTVIRMDPFEILSLAEQFVVQYYTVMNKCPENLHRFYKDDSTLIHEGVSVYGQRLIHEKFMDLNIQNARVAILQLNALKSNENSVLIQVSGEMSVGGGDMRRFMQSFVLCEQSVRDFYVLNDIFHYQDKVYGDITKTDPAIQAVSIPLPSMKHIMAGDNTVNGQDGHSIQYTRDWSTITLDSTTHPPKREPTGPSISANDTVAASNVDPTVTSVVAPKESILAKTIKDRQRSRQSPRPQHSLASFSEHSAPLTTSQDESIQDPIPPAPKSWAQMVSAGVVPNSIPIGTVVSPNAKTKALPRSAPEHQGPQHPSSPGSGRPGSMGRGGINPANRQVRDNVRQNNDIRRAPEPSGYNQDVRFSNQQQGRMSSGSSRGGGQPRGRGGFSSSINTVAPGGPSSVPGNASNSQHGIVPGLGSGPGGPRRG